MQSFSFVNNTRLFLGKDSLKNLSTEIKSLGPKVLVHYGQNSVKKYGIYDEVMHELKDLDIEIFELGGVKANPEFELVLEGINLCKEYGITGILAVGGGSVIDSAKAIAAGVMVEDIEDYFLTGTAVTKALPVGAILTIPAAGSEASKSSVINVGDGKHKRSINGEALYPRFAIINPTYFTTLSDYQTFVGITDIFSHLLERYFSKTENVAYTDALLEASMRTLMEQAYKIKADPKNIDARSEVGFIGTLAHNGLLGSGREEDWGSHRIEHELSARYDIAHGAGLAVVFPAWMKYVWNEYPQRFIQFSQNVMGVSKDNDEETIKAGIEAYEKFLTDIGMPIRIEQTDIILSDKDIDEMVENCFYKRKEYFGNFKHIYADDMKKILHITKTNN